MTKDTITKNQKLLIGGLLVFLVFGLAVALYLSQEVTRPIPRAAPQLTFSLEDVTTDEVLQNNPDERTIAVIASPESGVEIGALSAHITHTAGDITVLEVNKSQSEPLASWNWFPPQNQPDQALVTFLASDSTFGQNPLTQSVIFGTFKLRLETESETTVTFDGVNEPDKTEASNSQFEKVEVVATPLTLNESQPTITPTEGATLKLVPATGQINAGDTLSVDIILDTNDNGIAGVEAVIEYNKNLLDITSKEQIVPAPEINPDDPNFEDYIREIDLPTDDPTKGRLSVKAIIPIPADAGIQPEPLVGQDILVARIDFGTTAGTTGTAHAEYLCVSPPSPIGEFNSSYTCDPNPEIENFSLVSLFDATQPDYEGEGILTRVENGEYEISQPGTTPTIPPTNTPTPPLILSPTPTITPSPSPTPTPTPTPITTPVPGQAALKLRLNACNASEDDLSRDIFIKIADEPLRVIKLHSDGTTDQFNLPAQPFTSFVLKVMPKGHLSATFTITPDDISADNIIDLTQTPFLGGNSDYLTGPTGATSLALKGVTFTDENVDLDAQIVNVQDFNAFRFDWNTIIDQEHAEASRSDTNCSGKVNVLDYSSILFHWGKTSSN